MLRRIMLAAGGLILLAIASLAGGLLWLRTSLPQTGGDVTLAGLKSAVTIVRDLNAVPHIFADSAEDAYFALGYVHAQDRLWQMEFARRAGAGRLAEVLGPAALDTDRFLRTLGLYRSAQASIQYLSPEVRAALAAYADGVNAWMVNHHGALPPEFVLLGFKPEPWRLEDSLVTQKLMAIRLGRNRDIELLRARIAKTLSEKGLAPELLSELWPDSDVNQPTTIGASGLGAIVVPDVRTQRATLLSVVPTWRPGRMAAGLIADGGSNGWIVDGTKTDTGKPILANDPHLDFEAPIIWYLARIEAPGLSLTGATLPGLPFTILGHNDRIAWGITNGGADVEDLFLEKTLPNDPTRYLSPSGPVPFGTRVEVIPVKGSKPVVITVRETRHGPVVSDAWQPASQVTAQYEAIAFSSPALRDDDISVEALLAMNRARNWAEFATVDKLLNAPHLNLFFASTDGDIGLLSAGSIPIRRDGDGRFIAPGEDGSHDWTGFIPPNELPRVLNPPSGQIVNANNRIIGPSYPYLIGKDTQMPFRAERILEVLDSETTHSVASSEALQLDVLSIPARRLVPLMLNARPTDPQDRQALALLSQWDFRLRRDRPEPLVFAAWVRTLVMALIKDKIGEVAAQEYVSVDFSPSLEFAEAALTKDRHWCDDVHTSPQPTCAGLLTTTLRAAIVELNAKLGSDMNTWRWDDLHRATFSHRVFTNVPILRWWADLSIGSGGGDHTVSVGTTDRIPGASLNHVDGAGFRAVYDLSNLDNSRFIIATGESGNLLSRHYSDLMVRWRDGQYVSIARGEKEVEQDRQGTLRLVPAARL